MSSVIRISLFRSCLGGPRCAPRPCFSGGILVSQGVGVGSNGLNSAEMLFANEFLIGGSANNPPPQQMPVDQSQFLNSRQYRLYQRFQAYYELKANGGRFPCRSRRTR